LVKASLTPKDEFDNEKTIRGDLAANTKKVDVLAAMLAETTTPSALLRQIEILRQIEKYEAERSQLVTRLNELEHLVAQEELINRLTDRDVMQAVQHSEALATLDRNDLKTS